MLLRNVTWTGPHETAAGYVQTLVKDISEAYYDGNLRVDIGTPYGVKPERACRFVLRVDNSRGPGARLSGSGRRTVAATWQAHYKVMEAIFEHNPDATLISSIVRYDGKADFEDKAPATYHHNVGSQFAPMAIGDAVAEHDGAHC